MSQTIPQTSAEHEHFFHYDIDSDRMRCACGASSAVAAQASSICATAPSAHQSLREALTESKAALVAYLQSKIKQGDWHAVQDAASDIREIDAKLDLLRDL